MTTRDSVGVRVVEHQQVAESEQPTRVARIDERPSVIIGGASAEANHELYRVRGAAALASGRLVVAVAGSYELRYYDQTGKFLLRTGGQGNGPGEFRAVTALWRLGDDSVVTYDVRLRRTSVFNGSGEHEGDYLLSSSPGQGQGMLPLEAAGMFSDGRMVTVLSSGPTNVTGLSRAALSLAVLNGSEDQPTVFGDFRDKEVYMGEPEPSPYGPVAELGTPPFFRATLIAVGKDRIATADNGSYEITIWSDGGIIEQIIRIERPVVALTDRHLQEVVAGRRGLAPALRDRALQQVRAMSPHSTFPALSKMLYGPSGDLWIVEFAPPDTQNQRVTRLSPDGSIRGTLHIPREWEVLSVAESQLVVLVRDNNDVERVQSHHVFFPSP